VPHARAFGEGFSHHPPGWYPSHSWELIRRLVIHAADLAHFVTHSFWNQDNGKEQNRQILASLSQKCVERKANAQRIDDKQHREKRKGKARFVRKPIIARVACVGKSILRRTPDSIASIISIAHIFHARATCRDAWDGLGMLSH
jgi:hypothetical protein